MSYTLVKRHIEIICPSCLKKWGFIVSPLLPIKRSRVPFSSDLCLFFLAKGLRPNIINEKQLQKKHKLQTNCSLIKFKVFKEKKHCFSQSKSSPNEVSIQSKSCLQYGNVIKTHHWAMRAFGIPGTPKFVQISNPGRGRMGCHFASRILPQREIP